MGLLKTEHPMDIAHIGLLGQSILSIYKQSMIFSVCCRSSDSNTDDASHIRGPRSPARDTNAIH